MHLLLVKDFWEFVSVCCIEKILDGVEANYLVGLIRKCKDILGCKNFEMNSSFSFDERLDTIGVIFDLVEHVKEFV